MGKHFDRIICPHCGKRFDKPRSLKAHQRAKRHMPGGESKKQRAALQSYHQDVLAMKRSVKPDAN
jgi:hypothetical protein